MKLKTIHYDCPTFYFQMLSSEGGDTPGVHKSANGNNDDGGGIGANDAPCGNGDSIRATAASPYSSQGPDLQQFWLNHWL